MLVRFVVFVLREYKWLVGLDLELRLNVIEILGF